MPAAPGNPGSQGLVLLTNNRLFRIQPATLGLGGTACFGAVAGSNGSMALAAALPEWQAGAAALGAGGVQVLLYAGKVVRYMIAPGLDPTDPLPSLWRSETGRYTATGAPAPMLAAGTTSWQIVARGIEDLQLEYLNGNLLWSNNPGVVNPWPPAAARRPTTTPSSAACGSPCPPGRRPRCSRARPCRREA